MKGKHILKTGMSPGALVFTGRQKVNEVKVHYLKYNKDNIEEEEFSSIGKIPFIDYPGHVDWYDMRGLHNTDLISAVGEAFKIHSLALEDIIDINQRPRFDEFVEGNILLLKSLSFSKTDKTIHLEHIGIYWNKEILISFQEDHTDIFHQVRTRVNLANGRVRSRAADYLAFALSDLLVDNYYLILDEIQLEIEALEDEILAGPDGGIKEKIHHLKKQVVLVRKQIVPLREAISRFSKSENKYIAKSSKIYIRDLYDNTVQIMDMIDSQRDILNGLQDLYVSEISFKMNQVMQVLTIITTLFVPLSFLAGLYGMNFEYIPELQFKYGYFVLISVMFLMALGLLFWFKQKKWF